jgi:hypothetical protein
MASNFENVNDKVVGAPTFALSPTRRISSHAEPGR